MKSSSPICPASKFFMSVLYVLSVQNKIYNKYKDNTAISKFIRVETIIEINTKINITQGVHRKIF